MFNFQLSIWTLSTVFGSSFSVTLGQLSIRFRKKLKDIRVFHDKIEFTF